MVSEDWLVTISTSTFNILSATRPILHKENSVCFRMRKFVLLVVVLLICAVQTRSTAVPVPGKLVRDLARGSALKIVGDLCGGLPFEVWKSAVVMEHIRASDEGDTAQGDVNVLKRLVEERGPQGLWSGCSAKMVEGFFSGAALLAGKETIRRALTASPIVTKRLSPSLIGFIAGAGGGATQAIVMAPCSLLVTATAANGGSVAAAAWDVWSKYGIRGIYRGSPAVAARQATNWASRQGFTEFMRPRIKVPGIGGEILAGCIGGTLTAWNTPFEIARVESQSKTFANHKKKDESPDLSLAETMQEIVRKRGVGGLYTGLFPRICQSCYQTVFLVTIPRILDS